MFKSKSHETNFYNAMKEVDSDNFATQAVIYIKKTATVQEVSKRAFATTMTECI